MLRDMHAANARNPFVGPIPAVFLAPFLSVLLSAALGCGAFMQAEPETVDTRVVMWFDEYDEVFTGHAIRTGSMLAGGFLDVTNHHGDLRCVGETTVRIMPPGARPPIRCDGIRGVAELSCSDGRLLTLDYTVEEGCRRGYAEGRDDHGNPLHAVLGGSVMRASMLAREAREQVAHAGRLPPSQGATSGVSSGASTGTAFFVSWEGHLVTNYHVIKDRQKIQVQIREGDLVAAQVIATDAENDLALLRVDAIGQPLRLRTRRELVKGEEVFALGYPLIAIQGQEQKATFGRVNALSGAQGDIRFAQVDVPIQPGNSGGPLIDRRGEVVGVVTSMLHQQKVLEMAGVIPQNVNYALKAGYVETALDENLGSDWTPAEASRQELDLRQLVADAQDSVVLVVAW